jgi:hypothetical protein
VPVLAPASAGAGISIAPPMTSADNAARTPHRVKRSIANLRSKQRIAIKTADGAKPFRIAPRLPASHHPSTLRRNASGTPVADLRCFDSFASLGV